MTDALSKFVRASPAPGKDRRHIAKFVKDAKVDDDSRRS